MVKLFLLINKIETKIIKFEQLNIDLSIFNTTAIKKPKIQETSTLNLFSCFILNNLKKKYVQINLKKKLYLI